MDILVDGKIKALEIIDPKTGCHWEADLIGNCDGYDGYDDEYEMFIMTQDNFDWWENYISVEQKMQDQIYELRHELENDDREQFEQDLIDAGDSDLDRMQSYQLEIVNSWTLSTGKN